MNAWYWWFRVRWSARFALTIIPPGPIREVIREAYRQIFLAAEECRKEHKVSR